MIVTDFKDFIERMQSIRNSSKPPQSFALMLSLHRQMTECTNDDKAPIDQFFLYSVVQSIKPNEQNREIRFHPGRRASSSGLSPSPPPSPVHAPHRTAHVVNNSAPPRNCPLLRIGIGVNESDSDDEGPLSRNVGGAGERERADGSFACVFCIPKEISIRLVL